MKTIIALCIALTACGDNNQTLDQARATIKAECGDGPLFPGVSVAFESVNGFDRVLMSPTDWANMDAWRNDIETYEACVQGYAINK